MLLLLTTIIEMIIVMIMIALKGAICDPLQSSHCTANCLQVQHISSSGQGAIVCKLCATHLMLILCSMSCAMWYEGMAQETNLPI